MQQGFFRNKIVLAILGLYCGVFLCTPLAHSQSSPPQGVSQTGYSQGAINFYSALTGIGMSQLNCALPNTIAQIDAQIANLERQKARATSPGVRQAFQAKIDALKADKKALQQKWSNRFYGWVNFCAQQKYPLICQTLSNKQGIPYQPKVVQGNAKAVCKNIATVHVTQDCECDPIQLKCRQHPAFKRCETGCFNSHGPRSGNYDLKALQDCFDGCKPILNACINAQNSSCTLDPKTAQKGYAIMAAVTCPGVLVPQNWQQVLPSIQLPNFTLPTIQWPSISATTGPTPVPNSSPMPPSPQPTPF